MSSKKVSPTANLLRHSRLFSLPSTLPRPTSSTSSHPSVLTSNSGKLSDTATLSHPVQQAIATPASSQARGDWGLKRSLPLKSTTRTSTPTVRINALDTQEHITDFASAADLTVTGQKFRELGLPVSVPSKTQPSIDRRTKLQSAFELENDHTDAKAERIIQSTGRPASRWKFEGPWLAGLTQGEFLAYTGAALRGRRTEFLRFVREKEGRRVQEEHEFADMTAGRRNEQQTAVHEDKDTEHIPKSSHDAITDAQFDEHLRRLRADFSATSALAGLISEFLDLPGITSQAGHLADNLQSLDSKGPPATHPSAGLSYLRSDSALTNHSVLGPLARPVPQQARVLSEYRSFAATFRRSQLGLAGFVAPDRIREAERVPVEAKREVDEAQQDQFSKKERKSMTIGVVTEGGNRVWVEPLQAQVHERGQVLVTVAPPDPRQIAGHPREEDQTASRYRPNSAYKKRPEARPLQSHENEALKGFLKDSEVLYGKASTKPSNGYGFGDDTGDFEQAGEQKETRNGFLRGSLSSGNETRRQS